jgi:hypothetical protein
MLDENAQGLANNIAGSSGEKYRGQFARIMRPGRTLFGHFSGVIASATGTLAGMRCGVEVAFDRLLWVEAGGSCRRPTNRRCGWKSAAWH